MKKYCKQKRGRGLLAIGVVILVSFGIWRLSQSDAYVTVALTQSKLDKMQRTTSQLPCLVTETNMLAQHLVCYEGPFLEDGSDIEVVNAAALSVKNVGSTGIETAQIVLEGNNKLLTFKITNLPPGDTVLVLEEGREKYIKGEYRVYSGWQVEADGSWIPSDEIFVRETGMSELDVINHTDHVIPNVQICYKNYIADADILIGGVTNRVWLGTLQPGQTASISLPKYVSGYSRIVCIKSD